MNELEELIDATKELVKKMAPAACENGVLVSWRVPKHYFKRIELAIVAAEAYSLEASIAERYADTEIVT